MQEFSKQEVIAALKKAPSPIQNAFGSSRTSAVLLSIQNRHNLHVDKVGSISRELGYLLLGLTNPNEFVTRLNSLQLSHLVVENIVETVNKEIFLPLRERMRLNVSKENEETDPEDDWNLQTESSQSVYRTANTDLLKLTKSPQLTIPPMQVAQPPQPIPSAQFSSPTQPDPTPPFNLIQPQPVTAAPVPPTTPAPIHPQAAAPQPFMRTMAHDMDVLQHPQTAINPSHIMPASSFQTASVPFHAPVQQVQPPVASHILPGSVPPTALPTPPPTPLSATPLPPAIPAARPPAHDAIVREYGSDPYREPI